MLFKGQTLTLSLDTDIDLSGYTGKILYRKPNKVEGEWDAVVDGDTVSYDIDEDDIDVPGVWRVQAYAELAESKKYGDFQVIEFRLPLNA